MMHSRRHFLLLASALPVPAGRRRPRKAEPTADGSEPEREVFREVNEVRRRNGLSALDWRDELAKVARGHSLRMVEAWFFAHEDPVRGDLAARLNRAGIPWSHIAENLFQQKGQGNPVPLAIRSWLNSPGHRKNILTRTFTQTGVGVAVAPMGLQYITQVFLRPPRARG
jgi:uncharacterized protein YkwD